MRLLTARWLISHVFVATMVVVMVGLGFWQLQRLGERRDANDEVRAALDAPEVMIEDVLDGTEAVIEQRAVVLEGEYRPELEFFVANRSLDGAPGSWLVTPLELADGTVVAVARGFVPRLWVAGIDERDASAPEGEVAVAGRLHTSVGGGRSADTDDGERPELSRLDLDEAGEALDVVLAPVWVQLTEQQPTAGELPVPVPPPGLDEGPHLSYAFQWFFFATGTVVAYAAILRRRWRDPRRFGGVITSTPETLALLATRLRGRGTPAEVRRTAAQLAGRGDPALDEAVDDAVASGLIRVMGDDLRHSLTPEGTERLAALLADELDRVDPEPLLDGYEAFLAANQPFLAALAAWQIDGDPVAPVRMAGLVDELAPALRGMRVELPRLGGYRTRLDSALSQAADDPRWYDSPSIDSAHTVWFELHEHLLATLGRERADERVG